MNTVFMYTGAVVCLLLAAGFFASVMCKFPRLEDSAFLLITAAGLRLLADSAGLFQVPEIVFYGILVACLVYGFSRRTAEPNRI